ncbi:MAG: hypothetical protein MZV63_11260 [Marinilabiliales bacterium]|nr:hypothetical protein [Marinilabiliales bacterium]
MHLVGKQGKKITRRVFARQGVACSCCRHGVSPPAGSVKPAPGVGLAMFQELGARGVVCMICPNECVLQEGEAE